MTSFCISVGVIIGSFGHFKCSRCTYEVSITHVKRTGYVGTVLCPNITGTFTARYLTATQREADFVGDGCFYYAGEGPFSGTNDAGDNSLVVGFDASGSNSIYKGNTVQSSAVQVLIIIKT